MCAVFGSAGLRRCFCWLRDFFWWNIGVDFRLKGAVIHVQRDCLINRVHNCSRTVIKVITKTNRMPLTPKHDRTVLISNFAGDIVDQQRKTTHATSDSTAASRSRNETFQSPHRSWVQLTHFINTSDVVSRDDMNVLQIINFQHRVTRLCIASCLHEGGPKRPVSSGWLVLHSSSSLTATVERKTNHSSDEWRVTLAEPHKLVNSEIKTLCCCLQGTNYEREKTFPSLIIHFILVKTCSTCQSNFPSFTRWCF